MFRVEDDLSDVEGKQTFLNNQRWQGVKIEKLTENDGEGETDRWKDKKMEKHRDGETHRRRDRQTEIQRH